MYREGKKGDILIGNTNVGALQQLEGKNLIDSDLNEIKFSDRKDLDSFLNLTLDIQKSYDREVSALMIGEKIENNNLDAMLDDNFDLLLVGLKHSGKRKGILGDDYFNRLTSLLDDRYDNESNTFNYGGKSYNISAFYHTHPRGDASPSYSVNGGGDLGVYNEYNLPGFIKSYGGAWSIFGTDFKGKTRYRNGKIRKTN